MYALITAWWCYITLYVPIIHMKLCWQSNLYCTTSGCHVNYMYTTWCCVSLYTVLSHTNACWWLTSIDELESSCRVVFALYLLNLLLEGKNLQISNVMTSVCEHVHVCIAGIGHVVMHLAQGDYSNKSPPTCVLHQRRVFTYTLPYPSIWMYDQKIYSLPQNEQQFRMNSGFSTRLLHQVLMERELAESAKACSAVQAACTFKFTASQCFSRVV